MRAEPVKYGKVDYMTEEQTQEATIDLTSPRRSPPPVPTWEELLAGATGADQEVTVPRSNTDLPDSVEPDARAAADKAAVLLTSELEPQPAVDKASGSDSHPGESRSEDDMAADNLLG